MKNKFVGLLAIFTALLFTSCSKKVVKTSAHSTDAAARTEISFWHYMSGDKEGKYVQQAVDEFNLSQDKIYVKAQYLPRTELMKQYTIGAVSNELPDCGMVDNPDLDSYAAMGVFADITDLFNAWNEAKFLEGPLNSCKYEGKIYGLPWGNNCIGLFYNKTLLKKAGVSVPETWSELESACAKLTSGNVRALAVSAINNEEGTFQYMPWLISAGGSVMHLDSQESKKSLIFLKRLIDKGYISKECINWTQADAEKQFAAGQAAMMINGPWQFSGLESDAPDLDYGVASIPRADNGKYASVLGGENIAICKGAHLQAAWTFLIWITNKENSARICKAIGRYSPRSDVNTQEMFKDDPNNAVLASLMPDAVSRGPSPHWPDISEAVYTAVQEGLTGQKTIDKAMNDAQAKIDKINSSAE
jgi:multiple sugar transport system substrate-binding protein